MNGTARQRRSGIGFFVTFEGGEGAGKTTQIARLASSLQAAGHRVVATREPGGTPGADAVRALVLSGEAQALGSDVEALLFAAARLDHVQGVIAPALRRGDVVLCDRFHDSTRVYQGSEANSDAAFLHILENAVLEEVAPDLTLVLDIPAETGLARAQSRREPGTPPDRFEREAAQIHEARRQSFLRIAAAEPDRCVVVDADREADLVATEIRTIVQARFDGLTLRDGDR